MEIRMNMTTTTNIQSVTMTTTNVTMTIRTTMTTRESTAILTIMI
jgi:hypothetical protein